MILSDRTLIVLLIFLVIVAFTWLYHARASAGRIPACRSIKAFDVLRSALGRGAETGRPIHLSPGAGSIGTSLTMAETVAGLLSVERVVNEAALKGASVLVSSGDSVSHLALRGILRQAYQRAGRAHDYDPTTIQLLAHQNPTAYSTGVMTLYGRQTFEASQLLGSFRQEFLLFGEEGANKDLPQIIGAASMTALPVMVLNTPSTVIGEEVFAAESYLSDAPEPRARLMTQDILRSVLILFIVIGIIYSLVCPMLGLPSLSTLLTL
jgi:hypothetical protein